MACTCQPQAPAAAAASPRYRRILWTALVLNAAMFAVELVGSHRAGSLSLMADAIDFAGDALNYGVSLAVLGAALVWRARAAWVKAWTMLGFGAFVLARALWSVWHGAVPEPLTMGLIGALALVVNVGVALLLYAWREGDANMRSVWLCSRNDAIGNLAVMGAALGVAGSGTAWPDLAVATLMAALALQGGLAVRRQARAELAGAPDRAAACGAGPATHRH
jgi:Co/Zn/Cd efflux system component